VKGPDEARAAAEKMLGMNLVTYQTGPSGQTVRRVLIEQGLKIKRELYLGIVLDRSTERLVLMVSSEGGVEIEKVAEESPEKIHKEFIHPGIGLSAFQTRKLAFALGLEGKQVAEAGRMMTALYNAFVATDASLLEINPLIVTEDGSLLALDAKMNFDDNAMFRHPDFKELRDTAEEAPLEVEASKYSLNYIKLDGTIGCMVNGAGLAMATMDIIKLAGGEPANFLDVGGGANAEQIKNAFRILMADTAVRAVLINIFGGILRCDILAEGLIAAVKDLGVRVPIVIRMEGTNVEKGKQMLEDSGLNFTTADDMNDAAKKVVAAAT
jgi:succinyl-CoA synthetase beta subunit